MVLMDSSRGRLHRASARPRGVRVRPGSRARVQTVDQAKECRMRVRFWGVRGSVPWATPSGIGHGCNTPCLDVTDEQTGQTIVFDAGSGIVGLGPNVGGPPRELPIILTHYHWDHL